MKFLFTHPISFPDIINSEGPILTLVDGYEEGDMRLYLKVAINHSTILYIKVNEFSLRLYFTGRVTLIDLFRLREDDFYIIEIDGQYSFKYYTIELEALLKQLSYASMIFPDIPNECRAKQPFEILRKIDIYYVNSHESRLII